MKNIEIEKEINELSLRIANMSAHEHDPIRDKNEWWGNDTVLGDLPSRIKNEITKFIERRFINE
jgi:hypothetical protein